MSTNSIVTLSTIEEEKGIYVHWDGDMVGNEIQKIIDSLGLDKAIEVIMSHTWSMIDSSTTEDEVVLGHTKAYPGVGVFYTDEKSEMINYVGQYHLEYIHSIDVETGKVTTKPNK